MSDATATTHGETFKAEIRQLLHILAHSLYRDRDIFLRELISNSSDALTRFHFESLTNRDVLDPDAELAIHIDVAETAEGEPKRIVVRDSGIGMSAAELVRNLGTIAQSGAREFMERVGEGDVDPADIIGQFGVGFYSVFMVASEVRVVSRSFRPDAQAAAWRSDGGDTFRVEPADKAERGTEIHITLKPDAAEFANAWRLKQIVKKYSDYVRYPIYVNGEQANQTESLWRKPPTSVSAEDAQTFYQQMSMDFEEPLLTVHFASDAPVDVRALLFVPRRRDRGVLSTRREPGVMLYSHNVLIQEYCTDLLPPWLGFVDGVVDSEDLPLNVSRETVQNNRIMQQLGKTIRTRILRELGRLAESDADKYAQFWEEYGLSLKEGTAVQPGDQEEIVPFLRYRSLRSDGQWVGLDQYVAEMAADQEAIYYVIATSDKAAAASPHLDAFRALDLDVLYWADPLDLIVAQTLTAYKGKPLRNVADPSVPLPEREPQTTGEEQAETATIEEADFNRFVGRCVTTLGARVTEVRPSTRLKSSPVRLVPAENSQEQDLQRIYRMMGRDFEIPPMVLEVSRDHPLIAGLARLVSARPDAELVVLAIEQLYDGALLQEGLLGDPAEMLPRMQRLMQLAVEAEKPA